MPPRLLTEDCKMEGEGQSPKLFTRVPTSRDAADAALASRSRTNARTEANVSRSIGRCVVVCLLLTHVGAAQSRAPEVSELPVDISAEELQKRYVDALGGEAALAGLRSYISRGSVEISGLDQPGRVEMYDARPGRTMLRIVVGDIEIAEGCDGTSAWEQDPDGVKVLQGDELREALLDCVFLLYQDLKRTYSTMKVAGKARQGDQEFYLVDAIRPGGTADVLQIDARTYQLSMVVTQRLVEGKRIPVPILIGDYRAVGGVKLPHLLRTRTGDVTMTVRLNSIEINPVIDDKVFAMPR
jgi:hypothetical protein